MLLLRVALLAARQAAAPTFPARAIRLVGPRSPFQPVADGRHSPNRVLLDCLAA